MVGRHNETALPLIAELRSKKRSNELHQCVPTRVGETHQQQPCLLRGVQRRMSEKARSCVIRKRLLD
jgi:hypothetical protein